MYEHKTYDAILQEKLAKVASTLDKREGSIIYDTLAPNSLETAMLYVALDTILNESFADTQSREYLIRRCSERGIKPHEASYAIGVAEFNIDVPAGSRFSCDKYNWFVMQTTGNDGRYYMSCETAGADPNNFTGRLVPIDYIDGLTTAELTEIVINGEDEESTTDLRLRYLNSFANHAYGFNRAQYIEVTEALPGVGKCKPVRAWNGPGTVKLVITDSNFGPPSEELVAAVQTAIDPTQNSGEGEGLAAMDHEVTVVGVTGEAINVTTTLTFEEGRTLDDCLPSIEETLDAYYNELNATWSSSANLLVRVSQIESRLLTVSGIVDITDTKLNGIAGNITLGADSVASRGSFLNA